MPRIHPALYHKYLAAGGQVIAIGATAVPSTVLAKGHYRLSASGDLWFKQGGSAVVATKAGAGSTYLKAGFEIFFAVEAEDDQYVSIIQDGSSTGNASISLVNTQ